MSPAHMLELKAKINDGLQEKDREDMLTYENMMRQARDLGFDDEVSIIQNRLGIVYRRISEENVREQIASKEKFKNTTHVWDLKTKQA